MSSTAASVSPICLTQLHHYFHDTAGIPNHRYEHQDLNQSQEYKSVSSRSRYLRPASTRLTACRLRNPYHSKPRRSGLQVAWSPTKGVTAIHSRHVRVAANSHRKDPQSIRIPHDLVAPSCSCLLKGARDLPTTNIAEKLEGY